MPTETSSVWNLENAALGAAPLAEDRTYDVCVIGGGIAGLTTAYLLATEGRKVVVLEAQPGVAKGQTEYTTAHLAWALDDRFDRLASIRGDDVARAAADSHRAAMPPSRTSPAANGSTATSAGWTASCSPARTARTC